MTSSLADRFWSKVGTREADECWPWTAGLDPRGYGRFFVPGRSRGNNRVGAHRIAYELAKGEIPAGLHVLHSCDNRRCCNPAHLRVGTNLDNVADRAARKRGREHRQSGEANANAKLTDAQVEEIRRAATGARGEQTALARKYGVKQAQIWRILNGVQR